MSGMFYSVLLVSVSLCAFLLGWVGFCSLLFSSLPFFLFDSVLFCSVFSVLFCSGRMRTMGDDVDNSNLTDRTSDCTDNVRPLISDWAGMNDVDSQYR